MSRRPLPLLPLRTAAVATLLAALAAGCGRADHGAAEVGPPWRAVIDQALAATAADALPETTAEARDDVEELLDLAAVDAANRERAWRRFEDLDPAVRTGVLLDLVEDREFPDDLRAWAYAALRDFGTVAMVPRLTLRLKYEKDWSANVDLALALLTHGSGAGLVALETILATEDADPAVRARAADALAALPPKEGWTPGADFEADWQHLLEVLDDWLEDRLLAGADEARFEGPLLAECWRVLARFRSQPLRPVDDARRIFERLPAPATDLLLEAAYDVDRYVRAHALQTLEWIGRPAGLRAERAGIPLLDRLRPLLDDPFTRARALEALGAMRFPGTAEVLAPYLDDPAYDVVTTAADALLRVGGPVAESAAADKLRRGGVLSPEARYSLTLLAFSDEAAEASDGLDPSEQARRDGWAAERAE
jgi:HEAT repeat protein